MEDNIKYNYDDITIVPEVVTDIESRQECNPFDEEGYLPIFASCMSSVVSIDNKNKFNENHIRCVIPRTYSIDERINQLINDKVNFVAFSMNEAETLFIDMKSFLTYYCVKMAEDDKLKICIDLANGHMLKLLTLAKKIKEIWGDHILIMTGNIANPETYMKYELAGIDYVRCSIGSGNVCSTSSNTAIHMPVFSLLKEIYELKQKYNCKCKIVADGGIKGFRDIQKALIYADYVMIGSLFNKAMESAGKTTYGKSYWNIRGYKIIRPLKSLFTFGKEIPKDKYDECFKLVKQNKLTVWKELYGMSTKIAQAVIAEANNQTLTKLKTSEGLLKYQRVEYNIAGWVENEIDFLRSAMSYTNSRNLTEYKDSRWVRITQIKYNN